MYGGVVERLERDVADLDLDLVAGAAEEPLDRGVLLVARHRRLGEGRIEEIEGLGVLLLHRRADAAVVLRDELDEEVLELGRLADGLVGQRVVLHGLRAADVVDPDDERLEAVDPRWVRRFSTTSPTATSDTQRSAILR